jgi:hypothetical protein
LNYCVAEDVEGVLREELAGVAICMSTFNGLINGLLRVKGWVVFFLMPVCDSSTSKMIAVGAVDVNSGRHGGGL